MRGNTRECVEIHASATKYTRVRRNTHEYELRDPCIGLDLLDDNIIMSMFDTVFFANRVYCFWCVIGVFHMKHHMVIRAETRS